MEINYENITLQGCDGYQVNQSGQVRNAKTGHVLIATIRSGGYYAVNIRGKAYHIHEIVCVTFHGQKPSTDHQVDHIDRNELNNHSSNLRWVTKEENRANKDNATEYRKHLTYSEWVEIIEYFKSGDYSKNAISKLVGISRCTIINLLYGKTYIKWFNAYLDDDDHQLIQYAHSKWGHN